MPSSRPWSGARSRRLLWALAILVVAGSNPHLQGDDSAASDGAQVEVNGAPQPRKKRGEVKIDLGDNKAASVRTRRRNVVQIDLGDSKDATVEIVREYYADVEINGYRVKP